MNCVTECARNGGYVCHGGHPFLRMYLWWSSCVSSHARWSYCRWFRSLLLWCLSVKCYYLPSFVDSVT